MPRVRRGSPRSGEPHGPGERCPPDEIAEGSPAASGVRRRRSRALNPRKCCALSGGPKSMPGGSRCRRGARVSERRYLAPLPLGGDDWPPWSKGLMARALTATGLSPTRAYELARRADADMAERGAATLDLDRFAELAVEVLGEPDACR